MSKSDGASDAAPRHICIGTATRNRPVMLRRLLLSYRRLDVSAGVRLHFIIVENNESASLDTLVDTFRKMVPGCSVQYEIEPRLGIAFARNRILELALEAHCDLLTFADDDEEVDPAWLVKLLAERDREKLDIVGSPVRLSPLQCHSSAWTRLVWSGLDSANRKRERKSSLRHADGRASEISVPTGSWMGRLSFFRETSLRFDEHYALTGNEDGHLWLRAKKLGARTGWAPDAYAYETVPPERLALRYQFTRSRDYTVTAFRAKLRSRPAATIMRIPGSLAARILTLIYCTAALPFEAGHSLVRMAWTLGAMFGIFRACLGGSSTHYVTVAGN